MRDKAPALTVDGVAPNPLTLNNEGLTSGYSDCLRCARHSPPPGRTREASSGWLSNGKALSGWLGSLGAEGPSAANVVNPFGYRSETGCAAYDGQGARHGGRCGSLCRCTARSKLETRKTGRRSRGGSEVVDLRLAVVSSAEVWDFAVF
jgi:hypothetical protein